MRKKNHSLYLSLLVVVLLVGGVYLTRKDDSGVAEKKSATPQGEVTEESSEEATPALVVDNSLVLERKNTTPTKYASINAVYPEFKNTPSDFNTKISNYVNGAISDHNQIAMENWKARYDAQSSGENVPQYPAKADLLPLTITWNATQVNGNYISIIISTDEYSGGAHGSQTVTSFNYNVKTKKDVTLASLLPGDSNYLKTLSDFARKALEAQLRKVLAVKTNEDEANFKDSIMPMLLEGTKPTKDNFKTFTFTDSNINIYFAEYQVGPYVLGAPKVSYQRQ